MWKFIVTSMSVEASCCSLLIGVEIYEEENSRSLTDTHRNVFVNKLHTAFLYFKIKGKKIQTPFLASGKTLDVKTESELVHFCEVGGRRNS